MPLNETHDSALKSWVSSANEAGTEFPIQNLPLGVFRQAGSKQVFRGGVAIGDQILDLAAAQAAGVFSGEADDAASSAAQGSLNALMAMGPEFWSALRLALSRLLREGASQQEVLSKCLLAQADAELTLPATIGDFTDMYTSLHHATNIGKLFRPDNPLMPNFKWLPVGYHGRASSIGVSGMSFHRPNGQTMPPGAEQPNFGPCKRLDYELEVGIWVGQNNQMGDTVPLDKSDEHIFGFCILNDWSARDIQAWEYQPLGPFLAKNFASTISPWIVTNEALEPFRVPWTRAADDPQPLAYLESEDNRARGGIDITIESWLQTPKMQADGQQGDLLSHSSFKHSYWSVGQMVTHHAVGGCNLLAGDLIGSGTQSGPSVSEAAALIELTVGGKKPVALSSGESRTFLEDGDTVRFKGWCERDGYTSIGFGPCVGTVLPAK